MLTTADDLRSAPGAGFGASPTALPDGPAARPPAARGQAALQLVLRREQSGPLHAQIADAVLHEVRARRLVPGMRLPASRDLARHLGVDRKTVVSAYDGLVAQGWLRSEPKRGTFVAGTSFDQAAGLHDEPDGPAEAAPGIDFRHEGADPRLLPPDLQWQAMRRGLQGLQHGAAPDDARGAPLLRRLLLHTLAQERGLQRDGLDICLARSVQSALYLVARALLRPGDRVVVEALGAPAPRGVFRACGAGLVSVAHDADGVLPQALEAACAQGPVRLVYLEPPCHYPTAARLAPARRAQLLELARRHGFVLIEDDSDHAFSWAGPPDPPLATDGATGQVVHVGTVSALLAPDLQVAYLVAEADLVARVAALRQLADPHGHAAAAAACSELLRSGELAYHTRQARRVYEQRRALLAGLLRDLAPGVPVMPPPAGLAFWLPLLAATPAKHLHVQAAERGLLLAPAWCDDRPAGASIATPAWHLRLPFGWLDDDGLRAGVERLAPLLAGA